MKFVSEKKFKEITLTDEGKKGLAGIIEYIIKKPLKEYIVREFEDEILLISDDVFYLIKWYEKPHDPLSDAAFSNNMAKKIVEKLNIMPPIDIKLIAFNTFDNPFSKEPIENMTINISINEEE